MALSKVVKTAKQLQKKAEDNANVEVKNGLTKETHTIKKGVAVDPSLKKSKDTKEAEKGARVGFNVGTTLNMDNYESLRVDVWLSDDVQSNETIEEAIGRIKSICESELNKFIEEYR